MTKKRSFKFYSLKTLASYLGVTEAFLLYVRKQHENEYDYRPNVLIKKKLRDFYVARRDLRIVLDKIDLKILSKFAFFDTFQGAIPGRSLQENAAKHIGAKEIFKIDIKNFFPSINPNRVTKAFRNLGMSYECAEMLSALVTVQRPKPHLPQGFPTSPKIATLVLSGFDKKLHQFCGKYGWEYSFWVDDITFSVRPEGIPIGKFKNFIIKLLRDSGFTANLKKTEKTTNQKRMVVNGVVVNKKTNVPKERIKRTKLYLYQLLKEGPRKFLVSRKVKADDATVEQLKNRMAGNISYIFSINKEMGSKLKQSMLKINWQS